MYRMMAAVWQVSAAGCNGPPTGYWPLSGPEAKASNRRPESFRDLPASTYRVAAWVRRVMFSLLKMVAR